MSSDDVDHCLQQLAIECVASQIDRAVDDKAWVSMRENFADRLTVDVGAVSGVSVIAMSGDEFVAEVAALNAPAKRSYHVHFNTLVSIRGDTATLTAHSYGWNHCERFDPPLYEVWGAIDYAFKRERGRWLVTHIALAKWRDAGNLEVSAWRG
jgi:SnoaL-like domain